MASRGYTTESAVENYLLTNIDASFASQVDEWIEAMENEMDRITDRQLMADSVDAEYKYDGTGRKSIMIDDFVSITSVGLYDSIEDDTINDISDYVFQYPANDTPKWRLESDAYYFTKGRQNVGVTGKRGYVTEANWPADLKFACTVLVAGIVNFSNTSSGEVKRESIGRYTVEYTTAKQEADFEVAMRTLERYRRIR